MIYPWILRWVNVGRVLKIKIRTNVAAWSEWIYWKVSPCQ